MSGFCCCGCGDDDDQVVTMQPNPNPAEHHHHGYNGSPYGRPPDVHHHIPGQTHYPQHTPHFVTPPSAGGFPPGGVVCPPTSFGGGHGHVVSPPSACMPTAPPPHSMYPPGGCAPTPSADQHYHGYNQSPYGRPPDVHHHIPGQTHYPTPGGIVCPPSFGGGHVVSPPSACMPTAPPPFQVCPVKPEYPSHSIYPPLPSGSCIPPPSPRTDLMWVPCCADSVFPANAVKGGTDLDGSDIFVGRAYHQGDMIPAKVIPAQNVAYVAYGGREVAKHTYEVLVQKQLLWQFASNGSVPDGAVAAGTTADGDQLFVGRVFHEGTQTIGKVHAAHGSCYIPFNGEEIPHSQYEVLVLV